MPLFLPTAMRFYKLCAIFGVLIIVAVILFSWTRLQYLEENVSAVFEEMVTANLEVTGLKTELQHIDKEAEKPTENQVGTPLFKKLFHQ